MLELPTYLPRYYTRFKPDLCWFPTQRDLTSFPRLCLANGLAIIADRHPDPVFGPVACTASDKALEHGPLEREFFEASYVGRNNHLKVGFRVCYVAHPDN